MQEMWLQNLGWSNPPWWRKQLSLSGVRLEAQDVAAAKRLMTFCTQHRYFSEEYRCLSQKRPVSASSSILSMNPILHQKALIRACGRTLSTTGRVYASHHVVVMNGGNLTRSRYWVLRIKNLVKAMINSCKVCVIHKRRLQVQMIERISECHFANLLRIQG